MRLRRFLQTGQNNGNQDLPIEENVNNNNANKVDYRVSIACRKRHPTLATVLQFVVAVAGTLSYAYLIRSTLRSTLAEPKI